MIYADLVDSHAHLDLLEDSEKAVLNACSSGVRHILAVGIDMASSRRSIAFAERHEQVHAAVGIHPHDATSIDDDAINELARLAKNPEVVAIGETGLDYFRDRSSRSDQKRAFLAHIRLAHETGLPLIVHSRQASVDSMQILTREAAGLTVILHCFAMHELLDKCIEQRFYMSVAGNVTYEKAEDLRAAAASIPRDLLLTETDSPYLAPVPLRGKPNHPVNVHLVVEELARLRVCDAAILAEQVLANFRRAFNIEE